MFFFLNKSVPVEFISPETNQWNRLGGPVLRSFFRGHHTNASIIYNTSLSTGFAKSLIFICGVLLAFCLMMMMGWMEAVLSSSAWSSFLLLLVALSYAEEAWTYNYFIIIMIMMHVRNTIFVVPKHSGHGVGQSNSAWLTGPQQESIKILQIY